MKEQQVSAKNTVGLASLCPSIGSILMSSLKSNSFQFANTTQPVVSPFCRPVLWQTNRLDWFIQQTSTQTYQRDKGVRLLSGAAHSYARLGATRNHTPGLRKPSNWRPSHINCRQRTILSSDNITAFPPKKFSQWDIKFTKRKGSRSKNSCNSAIPKHGLYTNINLHFDDNTSHKASLY